MLLALVFGVANNALRSNGVRWSSSPALLETPLDLDREPLTAGAAKGVKLALRELKKSAPGIAGGAAVLLVVSLLWRRLRKPRWGEIIESWFRLGTAATFVAAAWYKIENPASFADAVAQYRFLPGPLVNAFAVFLPAFEVVVAAGLVLTVWTREFYLLLSLLWAMFIVALGQALYRRLGIACGCFALADISGSIGETWLSLLRDLVLIVPSLFFALRAENRFLWRTVDAHHGLARKS